MTVLFDSGCAATLVNHRLVKDLKQTRENKTKWRTKAGKFTTTNKCKITFTLPAFYEHREITWNCYVLFHMFGYLKRYSRSSLVFDETETEFDESCFKKM